MKRISLIALAIVFCFFHPAFGVNWTDLSELSEAPNAADEVLVIDKSDTTDSADGTAKRVAYSNFSGVSEATVEGYIFDSDAETVSGVWTHSANIVLDDGNGSTPYFKMCDDGGSDCFDILKTATHTNIYEDDGAIQLFPSGTTEDYLSFSVSGGNLRLLTFGSSNFTLAPDGGTTNITGTLAAKNGATSAGHVDLYEDSDNGSNRVRLIGPASTGDVTLTLPSSDGDAGEFLQTNGTGTLTWAAPAGSGDVTSVGDCADGACYDGTSDGGGYVRLYDGDSNYLQLDTEDLSGDRTVTYPDEAGIVPVVADLDTAGVVVSDGDATASVTTDLSALSLTLGTLTLGANADFADYDVTSVDQLQGVDAGVYIDMGTDGYLDLEADTSIRLNGPVSFANEGDIAVPNGTNPTTDAAGEIAVDSDDNFFEVYGSESRSIPTEFPIYVTVAEPDTADATDFMPIFTNNTGASITITKIYAMADDDDTDFRIEEYDADGSSNEALVKAETCDTGSGPYTNDGQSTITNATVENGHILVLDFDDTDTPDYVHITLWYTVGGVD